MSAIRVTLIPAMFERREQLLVEHGRLRASAFRFESGVAALRFVNDHGELVLLPFQGQQIWSATMAGRNLTMKSMFDQPRPTQVYLDTYGAFLIHCGVTAMGVPAGPDTHPLHGELPNAPYQHAWIVAGEDETGAFLELRGHYQHTVAFNHNYRSEPSVRLYADSTIFAMRMEVTNLRHAPMERMYLAHVNFRPVDNGRLVYSAPSTAERVRVRRSIPSHIKPGPGYREFIDELAVNPSRHEVLLPGLAFDPEIVFFIDYEADSAGWAHSMQVHPDGSADYIAHRPSQLDHGVRWISRTADQDCLGIVLPGTAESEGYSAEKAKGNVKVLGPGETWACDMWAGVLGAEAAREMEAQIRALVGTPAGTVARLADVPAREPDPAPASTPDSFPELEPMTGAVSEGLPQRWESPVLPAEAPAPPSASPQREPPEVSRATVWEPPVSTPAEPLAEPLAEPPAPVWEPPAEQPPANAPFVPRYRD